MKTIINNNFRLVLSFIISSSDNTYTHWKTLPELYSQKKKKKESREPMAGIPSLDWISESAGDDGKCCQEGNGFLGDKQEPCHCV